MFVSPVFPVDAVPVVEVFPVDDPSEVSFVEPIDEPAEAPVIPVVPPVVKFPPVAVFVVPAFVSPDEKLLVPVEPKFEAVCLTRRRFSTFETPETSSTISSAIRLA